MVVVFFRNGKEVYYCLIGVTKSWYQNWSQKFTYWFAVLWTALHEQNSCKSHLLGRILGIRWFSESSLLISMLISVSSRFSALLLGHKIVVISVGRSASSCVDISYCWCFLYLTIIGDHCGMSSSVLQNVLLWTHIRLLENITCWIVHVEEIMEKIWFKYAKAGLQPATPRMGSLGGYILGFSLRYVTDRGSNWPF